MKRMIFAGKRQNHDVRRRIILSLCPVALVAIIAEVSPYPVVLYNDTPSVAEGFWRASSASVQRGSVIAFHIPESARTFVKARLPRYLREPILKPVVATSGAKVCGGKEGFYVNGERLGVPIAQDHAGKPVEPWTGCSTLTDGQVAVFSDRIPNSYDSRYYGPIPAGNIIATYRPLWTW